MALIRWQPFQEFETLRRQMDRVFDELATSDSATMPTNAWKPAIELQDAQDNLVLRAELPGLDAKDIDVHVTREAVVITGENRYENKTEDRNFFHSEFRYGKFQRVISLPVAIQNNEVKADLTNGILTLTLPKVTEARRTVVKVNLGENQANDSGKQVVSA